MTTRWAVSVGNLIEQDITLGQDMRFVIVFAALCAVALSAPVDDSKNAQILTYENDNIGLDGYKFNFATSDGISREETAQLKNPGTENEAISVRGSVTWTAADGVQYKLNYLADENGFQPEGAHLPVAPAA